LTIAKRASAVVSALIVLGLVLAIYTFDEYDAGYGFVVIFLLLPTVVSLTITGVLYASDRSKSFSIWHIAGFFARVATISYILERVAEERGGGYEQLVDEYMLLGALRLRDYQGDGAFLPHWELPPVP